MKRVICLTLVAVVLMMALAACGSSKSDEDMIRDRIEKYISCANNADMTGTLECLDSSSRASIESMINIVGGFAGVDNLRDYLNLGAMFGAGNYVNLSLDSVENIKVNGDKATADMTMSSEVNGSRQTASQTVSLVKQDGDWYITLSAGSLF